MVGSISNTEVGGGFHQVWEVRRQQPGQGLYSGNFDTVMLWQALLIGSDLFIDKWKENIFLFMIFMDHDNYGLLHIHIVLFPLCLRWIIPAYLISTMSADALTP